MNTEFPVKWQVQELPITGFTLNNIYNALVENLHGTIEDVVLPAASDPDTTFPITYPLFDGQGWKVWDDELTEYKPMPVTIGTVHLSGDPTANRLQTLQNASGAIATLDDVSGARDTLYLKEGLVLIDWDKSSQFFVQLSDDRQSSFYMAHSKPGMVVKILIVNNGTKQTVGAWDSSIKWPGGSATSVPAASPGAAGSLLVILRNVGGVIYAESQNQSHQPVPDKSEPTGLISL